jgi:hypothetical protein
VLAAAVEKKDASTPHQLHGVPMGCRISQMSMPGDQVPE